MFKTLRTLIICTTIVGAGLAQAAPATPANYGSAAGNGFADRAITITPGIKWVNVNNGDTVAFTVNGKTFTWHFETLHAEDQFGLEKIAPEGVDVGMVTVYVGSNPLYRG
ncbi:CzcE family metal-binding protein [Oxalobacteraceae bacterium OTU3CINTB1]|nr:CzcE family metal-binding protein [Oxalobacteraceae bacterium OTU3CINTB1]